MRDILGAKFNLFGVACDETKYGFNCTLDNSFQVSEDGEWVLAKRLNEYKNWEIAREQFKTGKSLVFSQVHKEFIYTLILHESLNLVMSGANDGLAVLYKWDSGQVITSVQMDIGLVKSSLLLGNTVVLGGYFSLGVLDLETMKKSHITLESSLGTECDHIFSIVYTRFTEGDQDCGVLVVGGSNSPVASRFRVKPGFIDKMSKKLNKPVRAQTKSTWNIIDDEINRLSGLMTANPGKMPNCQRAPRLRNSKPSQEKFDSMERLKPNVNKPPANISQNEKEKQKVKNTKSKSKKTMMEKLKFKNLKLQKVGGVTQIKRSKMRK